MAIYRSLFPLLLLFIISLNLCAATREKNQSCAIGSRMNFLIFQLLVLGEDQKENEISSYAAAHEKCTAESCHSPIPPAKLVEMEAFLNES